MGYKCIVSLIVGNLYRNMTGISLIYRLSPDIEEDPMKREIDVLSNDNIISLKERIYEKDFINFSDIDAEDLKLWKVQVNNKEGAFSRLVPKNIEGAKKLLKGAINEFWEIQPSKEFTHIIVDSPLLTASKKLKQEEQDENAGDYIIPKSGGKNLKVLYHAEIIRINDVLQIERDYDKIKVMIQCKVTNFDDGILSVILIGHGEKRKEGISSLEDLEEWLLEYSLDYKDRPKKYEKASSHIEIIRNEEWLGSIRERVNYFNKNQDLKKRHKDSAIKSELKQDANLSEELSRLRIIEKEKRPINQAEKLGDREVLPVNNINLFKDLLDASDGLMENYENIPFSYVSPGFVNYTAVLIAVVDLPEDVSVDLPAKFGKYPVLIDYGAFEPAHLTHHSYHRALMPGISISDSEDYNKCTLGVLFKMEEKPGKKFILTVEHGVGCTNDEIIQPSKIDKGTDEHKCARVTQCVCDLKNGFLIDYAFCEVYNREVSVPINMPFESRIIINKYKKDVYNNNDNIYDVQKVGIETSRTDGILRDKLNKVKIRGYPNDNPYALIVYGCDRGGFGKLGDSGSPVFDKDGLLWGILQSVHRLNAVVIPIHVILEHAAVM